MTPEQFQKKWKGVDLSERAASHSHFIDLCKVLDVEPPGVDPDYCFEKGATKTTGRRGWADVWRKGHFGWEYKRRGGDLVKAYAQLQQYAVALENPPLLVVCDMDNIVIHTNFQNTVYEQHVIPLVDLGVPANLELLRHLFRDPERLRPGTTRAAVTEEAAGKFAGLAQRLRDRGYDPQRVAHFLNRIVFCLFAEDAGLLPDKLFFKLLESCKKHPSRGEALLKQLFAAMEKGGNFGADVIDWFNGGLFDSDDSLPLEEEDFADILSGARLDWSAIEASIFGTLFERGLDPDKRSQLGAHYTDPQSIMRIVQPVVVEPLLAEWAEHKKKIQALVKKAKSTKTKEYREAEGIYQAFRRRLEEFKVLDPACGSGNFLYLALQALKDIEHLASLEAEDLGLHRTFAGMHVGVQCVQGIELNAYAAELARVTIWIGEIQWMLRHGVPPSKNPILKPLERIECRDALLRSDGTEAEWPNVDAIVGNPPFLGGGRIRGVLGDTYQRQLWAAFDERLPGTADLVCYWFEKARAKLEEGTARRVGLVATNSIRQQANRKAIQRIQRSGYIFDAWSDEPWVNEGAAVRVSIVCFTQGPQSAPVRLDGVDVPEIYADLTAPGAGGATLDLTKARELEENADASFFGLALAGPFNISQDVAAKWLRMPNPSGRPNSDVLRPLWNGSDLTGRWDGRWVIDFGPSMSEADAALYELPFEYVVKEVKPERVKNRRRSRAVYWWRHGETRPGMRRRLAGLPRYIVTSEKSKHRFFAWLDASIAPDNRLIVFPYSQDAFFGVLSSRIHVVWALAVGSTLEDRPAYATKTCFNAFPFPEGLTPNLPEKAYSNPVAGRIADVARRLHELRENWLNPSIWIDRVPEVVPAYPDRIIPRLGHEDDLKKRTLTNLYNASPSWLVAIHHELDLAVAAAYGWNDYMPSMPDDEILRRLLELNLARKAA